jgi:hypothetical protein
VACTDLKVLLKWDAPPFSRRKMRLFFCACCRLLWDRLTDPRSREAVAVAERFADRQATVAELNQARQAAYAVNANSPIDVDRESAWPRTATLPDSDYTRTAFWLFSIRGDLRLLPRDQALALYRDIIGNPFRKVPVLKEWLAWNDRTVVKIAQAIYEERAFDRMPILADALEEAGCISADILDHCRQPGEHTRGCWLLDLVLGKS